MPRQPRFRGDDFRGNWSLGAWAEGLIIDAINCSEDFRAVPYGQSEVGPTVYEEIKVYWSDYLEREVHGKRPDILVFDIKQFNKLKEQKETSNLLYELVQHREDEIEHVVSKSLLGGEVKASIWQGEKMQDYGRDWSKPTGKRVAARELKRKWTAPTVIIKEEEIQPFLGWQKAYGKPIYVMHLFYDLAFMLNFAKLLDYIETGMVTVEEQEYEGAGKPKPIFRTFYSLATVFGEFTELAEVVSFPYQTKGGKFKTGLYFNGGKLNLSQSAIEEWRSIAHIPPKIT